MNRSKGIFGCKSRSKFISWVLLTLDVNVSFFNYSIMNTMMRMTNQELAWAGLEDTEVISKLLPAHTTHQWIRLWSIYYRYFIRNDSSNWVNIPRFPCALSFPYWFVHVPNHKFFFIPFNPFSMFLRFFRDLHMILQACRVNLYEEIVPDA